MRPPVIAGNQSGFILSYVLSALAFLAIATAMYAKLKTSQGSEQERERELDQMVQVTGMLHAGLQACGKCPVDSQGGYTGVGVNASEGFIPGIRVSAGATRVSAGLVSDSGGLGGIASMACPNLREGTGAASRPRYIWNNSQTNSSASRSVLGLQPPQLNMFNIQYRLAFGTGASMASYADFVFTAKSTAENPRQLYDRFAYLAAASRNMTTVDFNVLVWNTASRQFSLRTTPAYSRSHLRCGQD
jgi:hypothetical protein